MLEFVAIIDSGCKTSHRIESAGRFLYMGEAEAC